jgi:hypothetical protein
MPHIRQRPRVLFLLVIVICIDFSLVGDSSFVQAKEKGHLIVGKSVVLEVLLKSTHLDCLID